MLTENGKQMVIFLELLHCNVITMQNISFKILNKFHDIICY